MSLGWLIKSILSVLADTSHSDLERQNLANITFLQFEATKHNVQVPNCSLHRFMNIVWLRSLEVRSTIS